MDPWKERYAWYWYTDKQIFRYTDADFDRDAREYAESGVTVTTVPSSTVSFPSLSGVFTAPFTVMTTRSNEAGNESVYDCFEAASMVSAESVIKELPLKPMSTDTGTPFVLLPIRESPIYRVSASGASALEKIASILTEDEAEMARRGRNANKVTSSRNADPADYRAATGLETLFGYLYLTGDTERIRELFSLIISE